MNERRSFYRPIVFNMRDGVKGEMGRIFGNKLKRTGSVPIYPGKVIVMKILETMESCLGCGACYNVCTTGAIQMKANVEGFWSHL